MWSTPSVATETVDPRQAARVLRRAARFAQPYRRTAALAVVFVALSTATTLIGPLLVRWAIDDGVLAGERSVLLGAVALYLIVAGVAFIGARQQYLYVNLAGEGFLRDLRVRLFRHLQRQSIDFHDRNKAGVLVSRMTADIESMSELVQWGLLQFVSAALLLTLSFGVLAVLSWQLLIVVLLMFPVIIVASIRFQRDSRVAYLAVRERVGDNLSSLQEGIAGVRVIQAYGREDLQRERFGASNRALYESHLRSVKVSTWYFGLVEFIGVFATGVVIAVGGWLVSSGQMTVGTVIAAVLLLSSLFEPVQQLSQLYNTVQSSTASLKKIFGILDTEPSVDEVPDAVALSHSGDLEAVGIGFAYPGSPRRALDSVTLTIAAGERLALVGPTGAGKSTLAKLLARLYDPDEGRVLFGGVDLTTATMASLRERMVVVSQEGFLFSGTVADNIALARPDATREEIRTALGALGILERLEALPDGLDTEVRERGSRLSAGERQLVSLARVALVDPAVLILDEATSSLDPGTETLIETALETLMHGRSVVIVAHRLSTVRRADRIAVVDLIDGVGGIVEVGSHDELVARDGRYAALWSAWERSAADSTEPGDLRAG
jgi:ATP-binding cassette subfamily B protein